ncbi:hypothetical protein CHUAL_013621 [Chamberlinius hualienensis]
MNVEIKAEDGCCKDNASEDGQIVIEMVEPTVEDGKTSTISCHYHHKSVKGKEHSGLKGLKYKPLCSCEDQGFSCSCRQHISTNQQPKLNRHDYNVRFESWGKWKCWLLSLIIALLSIWLVVFSILMLFKII